MRVIGMRKTGINMKFKYLILASLPLAITGHASAEQLTIPNTFISGTKAVAEEVNQNFSVLAAESNAQDSRISSVEGSVVKVINESNSQGLRIASVEGSVVNVINENNSQNLRIAAVESATTPITDQLICVVFYEWPTSSAAYNCVQKSDPSSIRSLTYAQVAQENWNAVSVGGDDNNRITYIFSK